MNQHCDSARTTGQGMAGRCAWAVVGATLAALAPGAGTQAKEDWPIFRGNPQQTGVATSDLPQTLVQRWRFKANDGIEGTAAIHAGVVYVGSFDQYLYAIDLASGKEKWKYKASPFKTPASVRDGAVFIGDTEGVFHCVDAQTGKLRWRYETDAEITSGADFAGDTVLFGCGDENLYCLSRDGKLRWKFKIAGGPVLGSPAVAGDHTFASGCDSTLHVIELANGKEVGSVALEGQTGSSLAVMGEDLYIGTMTNQILAVDWKKGAIAWRFEVPKRAKPFYASVAATKNLLIGGSRDNRVYGLDRQTGKQVWSLATGGHVDSSPVVVGNRVFVGSLDGNLYGMELATGKELMKMHLGEGIAASPAVGEGCLVIGTNDGWLYCLGAGQ